MRALLVSVLATLGGCAAWNAQPARLQADYGNSVRAMVSHQLYTPPKAQFPPALAPDGMEGVKAESVLQQAYRRDVGKPETVRRHTLLGTPGASGAGTSGGRGP